MQGIPVDSRTGFYTERNTDVTEKVLRERGVPAHGYEPVAVL